VTQQQQQPTLRHDDDDDGTDSPATVTFDRELESLALSSAITELGYSIQAAFTLIFEVQVRACQYAWVSSDANASGTLNRNCDMPPSSLLALNAPLAKRSRLGRPARTTRLPR
jgi:hypothetical protein